MHCTQNNALKLGWRDDAAPPVQRSTSRDPNLSMQSRFDNLFSDPTPTDSQDGRRAASSQVQHWIWHS